MKTQTLREELEFKLDGDSTVFYYADVVIDVTRTSDYGGSDDRGNREVINEIHYEYTLEAINAYDMDPTVRVDQWEVQSDEWTRFKPFVDQAVENYVKSIR